MSSPGAISPDPGLCGECRYGRVIESRRGSRFHLCELSREDPSYPRYPRLPVVRCAGFARRAPRVAPPTERVPEPSDPSEET